MSTRTRSTQTRNAGGQALAPLDRELRVTLSKRDFATFNKALNGGFSPNRALTAALAEAKAKIRRA